MKHATILLPLLALTSGASPAMAGIGFACSTTDGSEITLSVSVGHDKVPHLTMLTMTFDGGGYTSYDDDPKVQIGQSWLDETQMMMDVVEPESRDLLFALRTRLTDGDDYTGTISYKGKLHPVACGFG